MTTNEKLKEFERILKKNSVKINDWYIFYKFQNLFSYELTGGYHEKDKNPSND